MSAAPNVNLDVARRFLGVLGGPGVAFTFQTFDDDGDRKLQSLVWKGHGTLAEHGDRLVDLNRRGAGIFVTVNKTDGGGRKAKNVRGLRALFVDGDDVPLPEFRMEPNIVVTRDARHWHAYWLLREGEDVGAFRDAQKRLIACYGTDPHVHDTPRVMRLPGFLHRKGEPLAVTLARCEPDPRRAIEDVMAAHPVPRPRRRTSERTSTPRVLRGGGYGTAALRAEADRVRGTEEGSRNNALNIAAFNLGQLVAGGELDEGTVRRELLEAALASGLCENEAETTICSGLDAGRMQPRQVPDRAEDKPPAGAPERRTDVGLAERLARRCRDRLAYCPLTRKWYVFDGKRWAEDETLKVVDLAVETVRSIYAEAERAADENEARAIGKFAMESEARPRIDAMVALARPMLAVRVDDLDADPWLLNVENGTIDLRSGQRRSHDSRDLITKIAPVTYTPGAPAPRFRRFLAEILPGDPELAAFMQRYLGMCLTGDVREQYLPLLVGDGENGKSTLTDLVSWVTGDYSAEAPSDLISGHRQDHPCSLASLRGLRFVVSGELDRGARLKLGLVKKLTGDATISARHIRGEPFEFRRRFKILLHTNHAPNLPYEDNAIWRRILRIPFRGKFPRESRDTSLLAKLKGEGAGVLDWLVEGCLTWQREGLNPPESVLAATNEYRDESDPVADFLAARCRTEGDGLKEYGGALYKAYQEWAKSEGIKEKSMLSHRRFGELLKARFTKERDSKGNVYSGVALQPSAEYPY